MNSKTFALRALRRDHLDRLGIERAPVKADVGEITVVATLPIRLSKQPSHRSCCTQPQVPRSVSRAMVWSSLVVIGVAALGITIRLAE